MGKPGGCGAGKGGGEGMTWEQVQWDFVALVGQLAGYAVALVIVAGLGYLGER